MSTRAVEPNVAGNARITGTLGAAIFVLLAIEGVTIVRVERLMWLHVFVGVSLTAFVIAKIASTGYRFFRYYTGQPRYVEKGAPPLVLRALGPVIVLLTIAVLGTGFGALLLRGQSWIGFAHKATFVAWFVVTTLHVLGHTLETPALAFADWRRAERNAVKGSSARRSLLALVVVAGVGFAVLALPWVDHWRRLHGL